MIDSLANIQPGDLYTTNGRDVWEVESFFTMPSITLKNLRTGEKTTAGIGALNLQIYVPLKPEIPLFQLEAVLSEARADYEERVDRCSKISSILRGVDSKITDEKPEFSRKIMD